MTEGNAMTTKDVLALALEALEMAKRWHKGDKWRNGTFEQRETWATAHEQLDEAITAIKQAQMSERPGACKACGNIYLASRTDVYKDKRPFIYCDCCGAMADSKTWYLTHGPAPKQAEPEQ